MMNHSMVVDDFFKDPKAARLAIDQEEMRDHLFSDGVTYPNIVKLPKVVMDEIGVNLRQLFGPFFREVLSFARYSFEHTKPPHWAHSDRNIAQFLCLVYLNDTPNAQKFGTCTLKHNYSGMEKHPQTELGIKTLLADANLKHMWTKTFSYPAKFNRAIFLNADLIHAAMGEYGKDRNDGRLVVSVFFDMVIDA